MKCDVRFEGKKKEKKKEHVLDVIWPRNIDLFLLFFFYLINVMKHQLDHLKYKCHHSTRLICQCHGT